MESTINLLFFLIGLIISIIIHEIAHGWVANKLGDPTARLAGRLSLNPIKHIDNFGSIVLPLFLLLSGSGFLFGWAKPVPIDDRYFKNPIKDNLMVSSAGIISNLLLAALCGTFIRLSTHLGTNTISFILISFFITLMQINLILAAFNLLPVPPLDGSKIFFGWIQKPWIEEYLHSPRISLLSIGLIFILLSLTTQVLSIPNPISLWLQSFVTFMSRLLL